MPGQVSPGTRYLLRFDDLCPTMNWRIWDQVEQILLREQLSPILAVIPDNRDPTLMLEPAAGYFWERVRVWQERGWSIALHGYQHRYITESSGVIGLNRRSEFAGLPEAQQRDKLSAALSIFAQQKIRPDLWVAPGHSFDVTTLALLRQQGIEVLCDGFSWRPYREFGMTWIPQQLWRFRPLPCGVWTVCLHHNRWTGTDLDLFAKEVSRYRRKMSSLPGLLCGPVADRSFLDRSFARIYSLLLRGRRQYARSRMT